jgi:ATP-dependent protease ClpP protease subunit
MEKEDKQLEFVNVEGNDVFFYCEVSTESIAELFTVMKKVERELFTTFFGQDVTPVIRIHIHSEGGDLHAGLGAMDFLRSLKCRVVTIAEGMCASAATFIFLGGDSRLVLPNSYLLIHQLGSEFWGKYENMKDEMLQCDRLMKRMKKIYLRETSLPEAKLNKLMKRDLYLSYRQCVKYGIHLE